MSDSSVYSNINAAAASIQSASAKADQFVGSLENFTSNLNKNYRII
jgi:hypothetical protein